MKKILIMAVIAVLGMATATNVFGQENVTFKIEGNNATPISTSRSGGFHKADSLVTSYTWKDHTVIINKESGRCWYINSSNRRSYIQDQEYCKWVCKKTGITYVPPKPRTTSTTK